MQITGRAMWKYFLIKSRVKAFSNFDTDVTVIGCAPYGNGHINDTYYVAYPRYILQRINTGIFKNPEELMENIENVTSFLRKKIEEKGGDPKRETLTVIKTVDEKNYFDLNRGLVLTKKAFSRSICNR